MPKYRVDALEKFLTHTVYHVEAHTPQAAEEACRRGQVPYDQCEILETDDEWIETLTVELDE